MSASVTRVSLRRRLAAWFALAGTVALVVTLAVILFNHGVSILIGIVGLVLAVAGGWWLVTEPMPRRAVGIAGLAAGLALMVAALANALDDADRIAVRAVLIAALLAITLACARARWCVTCTSSTSTYVPGVRLDIRCCSAIRGLVVARSSSSASCRLPTSSAWRR